MFARSFRTGRMVLVLGAGLLVQLSLRGQDAAPADAPPPVPKGVEVLARGPVHEAFASLTAEPQATKIVSKQPPKALEEMPPDEKPDGDVLWIGGYWAWDDDRTDFLWVSGVWRTPPPGKQWVAGYWHEQGDGWQWVPGFWTAAVKADAPQSVTYLPKPPDPPQVAAPGTPPSADTFYVPGHWEWKNGDYYWVAGFWTRAQPNYVWIPSHYRWTPGGYLYVAGYWDYSVKRRGVLYAPVVIDAGVVGADYVYTPAYAVDDAVVVDALFVRPCTCHYYFGDYYDVSYRDAGYTSCVVYSRSNYDSIIVYERYEHRDEPDWINVQVNVYNDRAAGRAPVPPRTLNQQINVVNNTTIVNNTTVVNNNVTVNKQVMNTTVLAPASKVMAAKGTPVVKLDAETRQQAKVQSSAVQQASLQRTRSEVAAPGGPPKQPRVAALSVPAAQPVGRTPAAQPVARPATSQIAPSAPPTTRPTTAPIVTATTPTTRPTTAPVVTTTPAVAPTTPATKPAPYLPVTATTPTTPATTPGVTTSPSQPGTLTQPTHPLTGPTTQQPAKRPPPPVKDKDKDKDK